MYPSVQIASQPESDTYKVPFKSFGFADPTQGLQKGIDHAMKILAEDALISVASRKADQFRFRFHFVLPS